MKTRFILIAFFSIFVSFTAFTDTIPVITGTDSITGSLRDAITKAQSGDFITFDGSLSEIKLGAEIAINKSLTITGNPNLLIYISKGTPSFDRIFGIYGSAAITINLRNLKIARIPIFLGYPVSYNTDGAILLINNVNATVNIDYCFFFPRHQGYGGEFSHEYTGNGMNGGGIANLGGVLNVSNSTFENLGTYDCTSAYWGNGGAIFQDFGTMNLVNCTFYKNSPVVDVNGATGWGAAICAATGNGTITNCTFCENYNSPIFQSGNSNIAIKNSLFYNNHYYDIRGIINSGGYNIFEQSSIVGSVSTDLVNCNPGFILNNGTVVLSNSTFWIPVCPLDTIGCAVDALPADGNGAPQYDERGFKRVNSADIGAYEYKGTNPAIVPQLINRERIKLYPNPATCYIQIEVPQKAIINVFNIHGQLVKTLIAYENVLKVDISSLPCGIYVVKVKTEKGVVVEKFVKE